MTRRQPPIRRAPGVRLFWRARPTGAGPGTLPRPRRLTTDDCRLLPVASPACDDVDLPPDDAARVAAGAEQRRADLVGAGRQAAEFESVGARRLFSLELDFAAAIEVRGFGDDFDGAVLRVAFNRRADDEIGRGEGHRRGHL